MPHSLLSARRICRHSTHSAFTRALPWGIYFGVLAIFLHSKTAFVVTNALKDMYLMRSIKTTIMSPFVSLVRTVPCIYPPFLSIADRDTLGVYTEATPVSSNEGATLYVFPRGFLTTQRNYIPRHRQKSRASLHLSLTLSTSWRLTRNTKLSIVTGTTCTYCTIKTEKWSYELKDYWYTRHNDMHDKAVEGLWRGCADII